MQSKSLCCDRNKKETPVTVVWATECCNKLLIHPFMLFITQIPLELTLFFCLIFTQASMQIWNPKIPKFLYYYFSSDSTVSYLIIQKMEAILNLTFSLSLITDGYIRSTGHFSDVNLSSQKTEYSGDAFGICCSSTLYKCFLMLEGPGEFWLVK